ncbi:succinate transmembrane transporter [Aureococcus anophagefferens]|nr:succinate transmembrane transporter [Aureococcus anophagefferens]
MWRLLALALLPTTSPFPSSVGCGEALEVGQFWMSSYSVASSLAIEVTDASGGAVACGGTVAEGEALRVAVGGVGSASFNIGIAGATADGRARASADAAADARAVRGAGQPDGGAAGADARADGVADVARAEPSRADRARRLAASMTLDGVDVDQFGDDEAAAFEASVADALGLPADDVGVTLADTATMVEADACVVAFTKLIDEPGEQTVGADRFVWSYGSGSLGFHGGDVGALTLDLETCAFSVKKIETVSSRKIRAHGGLLLAAFAALMPSALVAAKSRFVLAPGPLWIRIHIAQRRALILAPRNRGRGGGHRRHGRRGPPAGRHPKIGVGVMVVVGAMVLMGFAAGQRRAGVYFNYVHGPGLRRRRPRGRGDAIRYLKAADLEHIADKRAWYTAQTSLLVACFCAWLAVAVAGAAKRHKTPPKPLAPHRPSDSEIALKEVNTPINEREAAP